MSWKCPTCSAQWPLPHKGAGAEPVCYFCVRAQTEIQPDLLEFPYEIITFNVALKDIELPSLGAEPDPLGFVSSMGAFSIETEVALVATSRTYSPKLLELERIIEPLLPTEGEAAKSDAAPSGGAGGGKDEDSSVSTASKVSKQAPSDVDETSNSTQPGKSESQSDARVAPHTEVKNLLIAYFFVSDLAARLDMPNLSGVTKHALSLYRHCSSQSNMRNRHVESMATAALIMASRQFGSPRTIQEVAKESNVKMKEIGRYLKLMNESQKDTFQRPPENSHLVVEYVQRFCSLLGLNQRVQDVATHIATQLIVQTLTTRQNPVSISASAIYITCLLEDVKRTQSDICKTAALTEVTLRKCYREVAVHAKALLPPGYVPAVPIDRALGLNFPPSPQPVVPPVPSYYTGPALAVQTPPPHVPAHPVSLVPTPPVPLAPPPTAATAKEPAASPRSVPASALAALAQQTTTGYTPPPPNIRLNFFAMPPPHPLRRPPD